MECVHFCGDPAKKGQKFHSTVSTKMDGKVFNNSSEWNELNYWKMQKVNPYTAIFFEGSFLD